MKRETQRKGDIAVAQAVATFTRLGADVSLPLSESTQYDMVVDFLGVLYKVQVKYLSGKVLDLRRISSNSKGYKLKSYIEGDFDWLYIYKPTGEEYLITSDLFNRSTITPQQHHEITEAWQSG